MVLWHISHCRLFKAKSSLYIYIKFFFFGWVGFYGISTIVGYLISNPLYTYIHLVYMILFCWVSWHINHCRLFNSQILFIHIYQIYKTLFLFCLILWHTNHCRLFNAKSSLYIYIKYIRYGLVWFYGISTIVFYLMPNPFYAYISNIYDLWTHVFNNF